MIESVSEIQVRYSETDMMGIVYHGSYLPWLEIGRTQLLAEVGMPYREIEESGLFLPVLEVNVAYKRPAKYDDRIVITTQLREKPIVKIRMDYELHRDGLLLATGYSVHAFMNREGQAMRVPDFFQEAVERLL